MATAGAVNDAKILNLEAEAEYNRMLAAQVRAETKRAGLAARNDEIALRAAIRKEEATLTDDRYHHRYVLNGAIDGTSVDKCINQLTVWQRSNGDRPEAVEIVFNSPGGDIIAGFALFDFIQFVRNDGIHVTTSAIGYAASMAGILLQAGDKRTIGSNSWLMIHQAALGMMGKSYEVEDRTEWIKRVEGRMVDIFAARSTLTKRQIKNKIDRKDLWISSDEALEWGLVDEVR